MHMYVVVLVYFSTAEYGQQQASTRVFPSTHQQQQQQPEQPGVDCAVIAAASSAAAHNNNNNNITDHFSDPLSTSQVVVLAYVCYNVMLIYCVVLCLVYSFV